MSKKVPTYGSLALRENRWVLADIPPHIAIRLKAMFARIPKTQTKVFNLPFTAEMSADLAWFIDRYPMIMSTEDRARLDAATQSFEDDRAQTEAILLPGWKPTGELFGFRPGYAPNTMQRVAIELVHKRKSLLLGDDVGQGKTWAALGALVGSPYLPAAIVAQTHLPTQWVNEFIKPYTYLTPHIIEGTTPYSLPPANLYVFRYSNIAGWADVLATGYFKAAVFDEIQEGRTGDSSEKGKAMKVLADNVGLRLGLSATAIYNYGSEIWNIMRYIDADVLGPWDDFVREWCVSNGTKWLVREPEALGTYLRDCGVYLRRLREGRPINRIVIDVDYDQEVADKAEDLALRLALRVVSGSFTESGQAARELDALARQVTGIAKARSVAAYVKILLRAGKPVILTGWHREVYRIWLEELAEFNPVMYTGSETPAQKDKAKRAFMSGESDLFILSNRSGVGIDGLQRRCSTVVIGELDWSPNVYEQIFGRVDRPGQLEAEITAIFCVTNSGSDPVLTTVNAVKKSQSRGIFDPGLALAPVHSDVSHIKLLAQRYLERAAV